VLDERVQYGTAHSFPIMDRLQSLIEKADKFSSGSFYSNTAREPTGRILTSESRSLKHGHLANAEKHTKET